MPNSSNKKFAFTFTKTFHDVISGRRPGLRAAGLRLALRLCEPPYALAATARNCAFDCRLRPIHRVDVPVISVGNLTTGGTGKTPFVAWLARWFMDHHVRVAIVSRGYRAPGGARNDEALELDRQLPDVPHVQDPDRVKASRFVVTEYYSQLILLDDGFQHRRLHRDLDIVLIDALNPFGFEHLLPRGLLRESISSLARAHVIGLSRANFIEPLERQRIWSRIDQVTPGALKIDVEYVPRALRSSTNELQSLEQLRGQPVLAFCGIGNPHSFQQMIRHCGFELACFESFPDHHPYDQTDLSALDTWTKQYPHASAILCTEKDLVKIGQQQIGGLPLWALKASAQVTRGREAFEEQLRRVGLRTGLFGNASEPSSGSQATTLE